MRARVWDTDRGHRKQHSRRGRQGKENRGVTGRGTGAGEEGAEERDRGMGREGQGKNPRDAERSARIQRRR